MCITLHRQRAADCLLSVNPQLVFSSSATVYGNPEYTPLDEKHRLQVTPSLLRPCCLKSAALLSDQCSLLLWHKHMLHAHPLHDHNSRTS